MTRNSVFTLLERLNKQNSMSAFSKRANQIRFTGRILFLTEDTSLIRRQLEATGDEAKRIEDELAEALANDHLPLMSNISTDEITPGWVCFYYDETLGQYVYVGMRDGAVKKDEVKNGGLRGLPFRFFKRVGAFLPAAAYSPGRAGGELASGKNDPQHLTRKSPQNGQ